MRIVLSATTNLRLFTHQSAAMAAFQRQSTNLAHASTRALGPGKNINLPNGHQTATRTTTTNWLLRPRRFASLNATDGNSSSASQTRGVVTQQTTPPT